MSASDTPLLDELAARDEQVAAVRARVREVQDRAQAATVEAQRIKEALTEAFASDDQATADKLTRAKAKADAKAGEPWDERVAGAQRAADRAGAERDAWLIANISDVLAEIRPSADAVAAAVTAKARELDQARRDWHTLEARVLTLLRVVEGGNTRSPVPSVEHIDAVIRNALRATAEMPAPMPPAHRTGKVTRSPDDEREADGIALLELP